MKVFWILVGGGAGSSLGAVLGVLTALGAMFFAKPRVDGTFGMHEMLLCLPVGAVLGLLAGVAWALRG